MSKQRPYQYIGLTIGALIGVIWFSVYANRASNPNSGASGEALEVILFAIPVLAIVGYFIGEHFQNRK